MKKYILTLILICSSTQAWSQYLLKSIESKRNGESINAYCEEYIQGECVNISVKYAHPKKNIEQEIYSIEKSSDLDRDDLMNLAAHELNVTQMQRNKYEVFKLYRKVCKLGNGLHSDDLGCGLKTAVVAFVFVGVGVGTGGAGFAVGLAAQSVLLSGVIFSAGAQDLSLVQFPLFYPALALDMVRLVTIYPVKKIVNKIQTRRMKRKVIPVLDSFSYELQNPASLEVLQSEELNGFYEERVTQVRHKIFKIIRNQIFKQVEI
jgi:hypothetical protein